MHVRLFHVLPMVGRDLYVAGRGSMVGKLLDRVTVADGKGPELDLGELTTYLNDALLLAPSMLLGPATSWAGVDADSFDVSLTDAGRSVSGRVFLDEQGAPVDFRSTDRFADLPGGLVRAPWHTPVSGCEHPDGFAVPGSAAAEWRLPEGPLRYVEGRFDVVERDVTPEGGPIPD